jgi:hypothetical protein
MDKHPSMSLHGAMSFPQAGMGPLLGVEIPLAQKELAADWGKFVALVEHLMEIGEIK